LIGHERDDHVVANLDRRLLIGMQLKRLLKRPMQPPQRSRAVTRIKFP
jgi:hypothetical protein